MNIYWDVPNRLLIRSLTDSTPVSAIDLVANDVNTLLIFLLQDDGAGGYEPFVTTLSLIVSAKVSTQLAGPPVVYADGFVAATDSYVGTLALTSAALATLLPDGTPSVVLIGELTLNDPGTGTDTASTQFSLTVHADVHRATDVVPAMTPQGRIRDFTSLDGRKGVQILNADGVILYELLPA